MTAESHLGDGVLPSPDAGTVPTLPEKIRAMLTTDRASALLGIEVVHAGNGSAAARMRIGPDMVNGHSIAHGGLVFSLADTAFACAVNSLGADTVVTVDADIAFLRPAFLGDELEAEAVTRVALGRAVICDVTVRRNGETVAEFRARGQHLRNSAGSG
ncbi:hotdog fold thioesterase [Streptomyces sp. NPDC005799]|uniref:hotdog fold thioesterase n=1 Tax=Streptomyces sp. NPDC005799 TaxID=3154678 RepID=UPI0033DB5F8F